MLKKQLPSQFYIIPAIILAAIVIIGVLAVGTVVANHNLPTTVNVYYEPLPPEEFDPGEIPDINDYTTYTEIPTWSGTNGSVSQLEDDVYYPLPKRPACLKTNSENPRNLCHKRSHYYEGSALTAAQKYMKTATVTESVWNQGIWHCNNDGLFVSKGNSKSVSWWKALPDSRFNQSFNETAPNCKNNRQPDYFYNYGISKATYINVKGESVTIGVFDDNGNVTSWRWPYYIGTKRDDVGRLLENRDGTTAWYEYSIDPDDTAAIYNERQVPANIQTPLLAIVRDFTRIYTSSRTEWADGAAAQAQWEADTAAIKKHNFTQKATNRCERVNPEAANPSHEFYQKTCLKVIDEPGFQRAQQKFDRALKNNRATWEQYNTQLAEYSNEIDTNHGMMVTCTVAVGCIIRGSINYPH